MSTYDQRFRQAVGIAEELPPGHPFAQNISGIISDLDKINAGTAELIRLAELRSRIIRCQWWAIAGLVVALFVAGSLIVTGTEWIR
jgi:hypothetical protein